MLHTTDEPHVKSNVGRWKYLAEKPMPTSSYEVKDAVTIAYSPFP